MSDTTMNLFILDVEELTSNFHASGGLVVIASNLRHAKAMIAERREAVGYGWVVTDAEWAAADRFKVAATKPRLFVFPDAGCC